MARNARDEPTRAAMTADYGTMTIADAEGTKDTAFQALTTTLPYGLSTQQEAISLMYLIKNMKDRISELEAAVEDLKAVSEN